MGGQGRQIGGLALCLMGVIGVCVACGLPMWRETSFVGANIVTAQTVWDGLWLHCIFQATGQMQCKRHTSELTMTSDIQAGRALTLLSILTGLLGFIVTLLGGGVANCSGEPPDRIEPRSTSSSKKKAALLGGALCVLSAILCLVSVSWSAGITISVYNDPLVVQAMKREVGSSIYIGWASSVLLLLGGALICFVCGTEEHSHPPYLPYAANSSTHFSDRLSRTARSDIISQSNSPSPGSNRERMYDRHTPSRVIEHVAHVYDRGPLNKAQSEGRVYNQFQGTRPESVRGSFGRNPPSWSGTTDQRKSLIMGMQPNQGLLVRDIPSRAGYYYNTSDVDRRSYVF